MAITCLLQIRWQVAPLKLSYSSSTFCKCRRAIQSKRVKPMPTTAWLSHRSCQVGTLKTTKILSILNSKVAVTRFNCQHQRHKYLKTRFSLRTLASQPQYRTPRSSTILCIFNKIPPTLVARIRLVQGLYIALQAILPSPNFRINRYKGVESRCRTMQGLRAWWLAALAMAIPTYKLKLKCIKTSSSSRQSRWYLLPPRTWTLM